MTKVYIIGAGIHPFGRHDKTGLDRVCLRPIKRLRMQG